MENRKLLSLALIVLLGLSFLTGIPMSIAAPTALTLTPATNGPLAVGQTFDLTLQVSEAADIWGWTTILHWDPAVLQYVSASEGALLKTGGSTVFIVSPLDQVAGTATLNQVQLYNPGQTPGTGVLAVIRFRVMGYAVSPSAITLSDTTLQNSASPHGTIQTTIAGATFNNPPPPATSPQATFTLAPQSFVGTSIQLDGSSSQAGYDTFPSGTNCPITSYTWKIDLGNDGTIDATLTGQTLPYTLPIIPQYVKITLEVNAPDPLPPSAQGYNPIASVSKIVQVIPIPSGPALDIYTPRGGIGYSVASDPYGPQELIQISGVVTYNNAPVVGKDVAFEIKDKNNATIAYRVARTNAQGVASTEFRIPWPDSNPDGTFGSWLILGTLDVSQQTAKDFCRFTFDYIIKITGVAIQNPSSGVVQRNHDLTVRVSYRNIRSVTVSTVFTVTLYDNSKVPVAVLAVGPTGVVGNASTYTDLMVHVPTWAFVGSATVYADAFSALPHDAGLPYCPEVSQTLLIQV